jgi:hypothetical protein
MEASSPPTIDVAEKAPEHEIGSLSASSAVGLLLSEKDNKLYVDSVVTNGAVFRAGNVVWRGDILQVEQAGFCRK